MVNKIFKNTCLIKISRTKYRNQNRTIQTLRIIKEIRTLNMKRFTICNFFLINEKDQGIETLNQWRENV